MNEPVPGQPIAEPPAAGSAQTPTASPEPTLLEHEQQFHETPVSDDDEEAGEAGRTLNKRRHRSKKDQAGAGDVPRIQELTRKLREAESKIVQPATPAAPAQPSVAAVPPAPPPASQSPQPRDAPPLPQSFPTYEAFIAIQGNESASYDDYTDARADWRYAHHAASERQRAALDTQQQHERERMTRHQQTAIPAARQTYPDYDAAISASAAMPLSPVMIAAIYESDHSGDITYWLATHPTESQQLYQETAQMPSSAHVVMRRYLEAQLPTPAPRGAAVATGPALTLVPPPAPKPPSPVRTSALTPADAPPGETGSLYDHEKFYGTPRQRRRRA